MWFAASLREVIARAEAGRGRLASISFAGAVIVAAGIAVSGAIQFAAADRVKDVSPGVTQTIHVIYEDFWFPFAVGFGLFALAAGLAAVRHGAFDKRLGWIAVVLGVLCISPLGLFGFLGTVVWIGIAGVVLYRKTDPVGSGAEPPASTGPSIEVPPGAGPPSPA